MVGEGQASRGRGADRLTRHVVCHVGVGPAGGEVVAEGAGALAEAELSDGIYGQKTGIINLSLLCIYWKI